jgi:competence protein ComEA
VHLPLLLAALAISPPTSIGGGVAGLADDGLHANPDAPARVRTRKPPMKAAVTGVVNVNRASEAELRLLPGIGRGRAKAIIARRAKRPFTSLEELARMKGMKGVVRKLRMHLTVQGDTTVRPAPP